jgi:glycosyltransferase involved in cell wall biosynthesis
MRIGFGCTGLLRGITPGHIDGIGVYTNELLHAIPRVDPACILKPTLFGSKDGVEQKSALRFPLSYELGSAISYTTRLKTVGSDSIESEIDLFHATDHYIPKLKNVPVVSTIMDVIPIKHPELANPKLRQIKNRVFIDAANSSNHVITISEFSASDIVNYMGLDRSRITVIPLGVNGKFFSQISTIERELAMKKFAIRPDYFLFLGTLQPRKNLERVLDAYQALSKNIQEQHALVVVGAAREGMDHLQQRLTSMGEKMPVKWLRYIDSEDLMPVIQSAKALVFPSLYEGFGLPVLEAFASRIPVITSNTSSLPEVAGEAAILVDPLSSDAIAHAMRTIAEDSALCSLLVEKGTAQVTKFTWAHTAKKTLEVYKNFSR